MPGFLRMLMSPDSEKQGAKADIESQLILAHSTLAKWKNVSVRYAEAAFICEWFPWP